jgi:hypothetical protein
MRKRGLKLEIINQTGILKHISKFLNLGQADLRERDVSNKTLICAELYLAGRECQ